MGETIHYKSSNNRPDELLNGRKFNINTGDFF